MRFPRVFGVPLAFALFAIALQPAAYSRAGNPPPGEPPVVTIFDINGVAIDTITWSVGDPFTLIGSAVGNIPLIYIWFLTADGFPVPIAETIHLIDYIIHEPGDFMHHARSLRCEWSHWFRQRRCDDSGGGGSRGANDLGQHQSPVRMRCWSAVRAGRCDRRPRGVSDHLPWHDHTASSLKPRCRQTLEVDNEATERRALIVGRCRRWLARTRRCATALEGASVATLAFVARD